MGLPGHRRSSSHKRRRAAHFALTSVRSSVCSHCGAKRLSHTACPKCGYYRGRLVGKSAPTTVTTKRKSTKKS